MNAHLAKLFALQKNRCVSARREKNNRFGFESKGRESQSTIIRRRCSMTASVLDGKRILAVDDEPDVLTVLEREIKDACVS